MDITSLGVGIFSAVMLPLVTIIKKSYTTEKRITILETDSENSKETLTRLESKLDRLIERFL